MTARTAPVVWNREAHQGCNHRRFALALLPRATACTYVAKMRTCQQSTRNTVARHDRNLTSARHSVNSPQRVCAKDCQRRVGLGQAHAKRRSAGRAARHAKEEIYAARRTATRCRCTVHGTKGRGFAPQRLPLTSDQSCSWAPAPPSSRRRPQDGMHGVEGPAKAGEHTLGIGPDAVRRLSLS